MIEVRVQDVWAIVAVRVRAGAETKETGRA